MNGVYKAGITLEGKSGREIQSESVLMWYVLLVVLMEMACGDSVTLEDEEDDSDGTVTVAKEASSVVCEVYGGL